MRYDEKEEKGVPMFRDILYSICNSQVKQIEKRQKDLALDTEAVILSRNQPYKEKYSPSHLYDVYQPRAIEDPFQLPLIITIHGGAFIVGDKKYHRYYSGFIAVQNYQIAPINFRVISEEVNLKEEIQDIFDAINDVVKVFKGFPRLYIMGESAGAMLAILVCAIWNDPKLQKKFGVKVPDYKLNGLALIACPYNHQLYPKFMAPINYSSNKMLFARCPELKELVDAKKLWNENMPPVFITDYDKDIFYKRQLDFEEFLKSRNHPYRSMYVNHKDVEEKLFHTFNVIRPDYEISKKINLEMIAYFNELAEKEKKAKKSKK